MDDPALAAAQLSGGQFSFEAAPLGACLPVLTAIEPLTGIAYGIGGFGEHIRLTAGWLAVEAAGLAAMVAGVILVARSPMITGHRGGASALRWRAAWPKPRAAGSGSANQRHRPSPCSFPPPPPTTPCRTQEATRLSPSSATAATARWAIGGASQTLTFACPSDYVVFRNFGLMLQNPSLSPREVPHPPSDRWGPRRAAPILLGALLAMLAVTYQTPHAATAPGPLPTSPQTGGCTEVSPGPANLLGAMGGQPPIPGQGVWACR